MLREDRRLKLGGGKKYDARIDYIENTGTSYIDTKFKPNQDTKIIADMLGVTSTDYGRLFGCVGGTSYNSAPTFELNYETGFTGTLHFMWGTDTSWNTNSNYSSSTATKRTVYTVDKNVLKVDGTTAFTRTYTSWLATANLAIFSYMKTNGITTDAGENFKGRLYGFKIYDNGTLIRDYIPVRVGTEACLYDTVTDELYHNAGTGSFTYGGDVIPILYLQSTGTQYIDTRVIPDSNYKIECEFLPTIVTSSDQSVMWGSGVSYNDRNLELYTSGSGTLFEVHYSAYAEVGTCAANNVYKFVLDKGDITIYNADETVNATYSFGSKTFTCPYTMYLFALHRSNIVTGPGGVRIMSFKMWDGNGTLVRDYIPAVAGTTGYMYDIENDILYSNAGSGTFKLSPDSGYVETEYAFSASNTSISHAYGGASTNVTITSTADGASQGYYVSSKPSWVTTSISGSTLTITSSSNSRSARSGSVILTQNDSGNIISISVYQAGDPYNGHAYVDLGLPSGTKWATMNVGASTIFGYGYYNPLPNNYDAASRYWGGSWHTPTRQQFQELIDYCNYYYTTTSGVNGIVFASTSTDASIFLPYAGIYYNLDEEGLELNYEGTSGRYWTSSPSSYTYYHFVSYRNGSRLEASVSDVYASYDDELTIRPVVG